MMKKKNYLGSIEEIDMLFDADKEQPDKVHNDVI